MSGLPNLQKLIESSTRGPWEPRENHPKDVLTAWEMNDPYPWGRLVICEHAGVDAPLIAAAPALADLLIACEQALDIAHGILDEEGYFCDPDFPEAQKIDLALARLADYDKELA